MDITKEDIISYHRNRASMYSFFANIYEIEANDDFISTLKQIIALRADVDDLFTDDFKRINDFINIKNPDMIDDLAADYAKVFLGVGEKQSEAAFPYESVYTSTQGLLMQEARDEVLQIYRDNGFVVKSDVRIPEDHIYIQFQFMAEIAKRSIVAIENDDNEAYQVTLATQLNLIEKHFNRWIYRFFSEINDVASTDYYKAMADMTSKYIKMDEEILKDFIAEAKN